MGKTWRKERYESDEGSSRSFAKNQKQHWVEQEVIDEFRYGLSESEDEDEEMNNNK
jgi:hypothetical protein